MSRPIEPSAVSPRTGLLVAARLAAGAALPPRAASPARSKRRAAYRGRMRVVALSCLLVLPTLASAASRLVSVPLALATPAPGVSTVAQGMPSIPTMGHLPSIPAHAAAATPSAAAALPLRDIRLPAEPSWWPPAPGWWIVAGTLLLIVLGVLAWLQRRRRARRAIARVLERIAADCQAAGDDGERAACLHDWLRRGARGLDGALHAQGEAWRAMLAQVDADPGVLDALLRIDARLYQPQAPFDAGLALAATQHWMRRRLARADARRMLGHAGRRREPSHA